MSMQNIWSVQTEAPALGKLSERFDIDLVAGAMGARVGGLDVSSLDDEGVSELRGLLHQFKAVMLNDQRADLDVAAYAEFGRRLGPLATDPYVDPIFPEQPEVMGLVREANDSAYNFGGDWHSDGSYLEEPGGLTVLWSRDVPPVGGDTLFSNLELAWHMLSPTFKDMLASRRCIHAATGYGASVDAPKKGDYSPESFAPELQRIEAVHPIKRTHPETGAHSLYVNQAYTTQIEGCTPDESAGILKFLFDWSASPAMTARFSWQPNSILIWDNRNTAHYAIGDYGGHRREMYRLAVTGEKPV